MTIYRGNLLPPFYIGYTTVKKIEKGYRGSVSSKRYRDIWLQEINNHPELFETTIISMHENKTDAVARELYLQRHLKVVTNPLYMNQSAFPHVDRTGVKATEETKQRMRDAHLGIKRKPHSDETRLKMSLAMRGKKKSAEHVAKITASRIGKKQGPHSPEHRLKLSLARKKYLSQS